MCQFICFARSSHNDGWYQPQPTELAQPVRRARNADGVPRHDAEQREFMPFTILKHVHTTKSQRSGTANVISLFRGAAEQPTRLVLLLSIIFRAHLSRTLFNTRRNAKLCSRARCLASGTHMCNTRCTSRTAPHHPHTRDVLPPPSSRSRALSCSSPESSISFHSPSGSAASSRTPSARQITQEKRTGRSSRCYRRLPSSFSSGLAFRSCSVSSVHSLSLSLILSLSLSLFILSPSREFHFVILAASICTRHQLEAPPFHFNVL